MRSSNTVIYRKRFADELAAILKDNLAEDQDEDFAQTLAHACARDERLPSTRSMRCWTASV